MIRLAAGKWHILYGSVGVVERNTTEKIIPRSQRKTETVAKEIALKEFFASAYFSPKSKVSNPNPTVEKKNDKNH